MAVSPLAAPSPLRAGLHRARTTVGGLPRAHQDADHRAVARRHRACDVPRAPRHAAGVADRSRRLVGGAMAAASAHALNCVVDADIDAKMKRTARRPLAKGEVPPRNALVFGLVLGALSAVWLGAHHELAGRGPLGRRRSRSTCWSTRCCSSAVPRRTSSGAAPRAACRSSSAGRRSRAVSAGPRS